MERRSHRPRLKRLFDPLRPRMLPGIVVIGAQKAGTSALFNMLALHPRIIAPEEKELSFFNDDAAYARGLSHYRSMLPMRPLRGAGHVTMDATPGYLSSAVAAERIAAHMPDAVLVAILRDPVRRAYSDWNMFRQFQGHPRFSHLYDPRTFEEAVREELSGNGGKVRYLHRGHYAVQLERYFKVFGRDRLLLIPYPAFKQDPAPFVAEILSRAGLDPALMPVTAGKVRANVRPYADPIPPQVVAELEAYYRPHMEQLTQLLGAPPDLHEQA